MLRTSRISATIAAAITMTVLTVGPVLSQSKSRAAQPESQSEPAAESTSVPKSETKSDLKPNSQISQDDGAPLFVPAEPVLDSGPGPAPGLAPGRILNGGVSHTAKRGLLHGLGAGSGSGSGNNSGAARPGVRVNRLTAEEYRRLEYGVIGFNAELRFNFSGPVVTSVFPSCPAALAGIIPGDLLIRAGDHTFQSGEGQDVLWRVVGGKAGTPVDVTVVRDGRAIQFHLVRMNIEDIADDRIRDYYEGILSTYGAPGEVKE